MYFAWPISARCCTGRGECEAATAAPAVFVLGSRLRPDRAGHNARAKRHRGGRAGGAARSGQNECGAHPRTGAHRALTTPVFVRVPVVVCDHACACVRALTRARRLCSVPLRIFRQETLLYFPHERKSLVMAYVLLLIGGVFGLHWAYLGDERKYKLYACTLGLCGVGVIRDLMRLPELVAEVNASPGRRRRSELDISQGSSPSDSRNASRSATPQQTPLHAQRQARALALRGRDVEEGGGGMGSVDAVGGRGQGGGAGNAGRGGGVAGAGGMQDGQSRGAPQVTSGRRRLTQAQELKHLCDMFSNLDAEEIKRTWAEVLLCWFVSCSPLVCVGLSPAHHCRV